MGEVYRARDTKLSREVAIKVLPEAFAADPDRLTRFTREAQTLASINHPNIAAIYGIEESAVQASGARVQALVMELVEGEDLSAHIARGAMPLADALPIARQIAEALEAAHELNIVHRDLKPANIKVRADGTVKVLDFGLAKAVDPAGSSGSIAANSPTLTAHATQMGMIIGTAAYMSPEQAKGKPVDRRADIWAFGAVLFEMLTGQQAFAGDSVTEILGAVVLKDPDWSKLPAATPARLRELLQRCLQRDPRTRQRGMGDVTLELVSIASGSSGITPAVAPAAAPPRSSAVIVAGALVIAALGIVIGWWLPRASPGPPLATRFIASGAADRRADAPVVSPDGRILVFVSGGRLYKRDFGGFESTPIPGTEGANTPMISPDGRAIAYFANGSIRRVSLAGGDATTITEARSSMPGAVWGPDDTILFSRGWATGLSAVPAAGGEVRQLTEPDRAKGERGHWRPHPLPDGQRVIFTIVSAGTGVNDSRIGVLNLKTGQHRALFPGSDGVYLESGHILYFRAGTWHVVPFDAAAEKVTGDPITVLNDAGAIPPDGGDSWNTVSVAGNGTLAYQPGPVFPKRELVWMDRTGKTETLGLPPHALYGASLSPDGRQVAASRVEGGMFELWMNDVERKTEDRLDIKGNNFGVSWSPRGDAIVFISIRKGEYDIYKARPDGSNVEPVLTRDFDEAPMQWLKDGRRFIVKEWLPDGSTPVKLLEPGASNSQEILLYERGGGPFRLSPDERWLVYASPASGTSQVYVKSMVTHGT